MNDIFMPPPFGDNRPSYVIDGNHFRDDGDALRYVMDQGFAHHEADDYLYELRMTWYRRGSVPAPAEPKSCPCMFVSIKGVASCGVHQVSMRHTPAGWACPVSAWMFPFGASIEADKEAPAPAAPSASSTAAYSTTPNDAANRVVPNGEDSGHLAAPAERQE